MGSVVEHGAPPASGQRPRSDSARLLGGVRSERMSICFPCRGRWSDSMRYQASFRGYDTLFGNGANMSLRHDMHRPAPGPVPVFESSSENWGRNACACARWRREGGRLCAQRGWRAKLRAGCGMHGILQRFGLSIPHLLQGDFKPYPNVTPRRVAYSAAWRYGVADPSPSAKCEAACGPMLA